MIASTELYQLIKSMTKTEKKYFRENMPYETGKDYIIVFDSINRQIIKDSPYNESILHSKIKDKILLKNISSVKNYLYHAILRTLINYSSGRPKFKITRLIDSIEILMERGLYISAYKLLKSTRKLLIKDHMMEYELILNGIELTLLRRLGYHKLRSTDITAKISSSKTVLHKLENHLSYRYIANQFYLKLTTEGAPDTSEQMKYFDDLMIDPLMKTPEKAITLVSKKDYYDLSAHYSLLSNDFEGSIKNLREMLKLYENNPGLKYQTFVHYFSVIHNLLLSLIQLKRFNEAQSYVNELKEEITAGKIRLNALLRMRFATLYQIELMILSGLGEFEKVEDNIEQIEEILSKYGNKLGELLKFSLIYHTSCCYFGMGRYKTALDWVNKLIRKDSGEVPSDYDVTAGILKLITHFEMKDYNYIQYYSVSLQNLMMKNKNRKFTEYALSSVIKKIAIKDSEDNFQYLFKELLRNYHTMPTLHRELTFDLYSWIQSKTEDKTFSGIIRSNKNVII